MRIERDGSRTDPNFLHAGDHVHLGYGLTSERLREPALAIQDLPPLDFCILSHAHEDHFDRIAAAGLPKDLPVVTTPHAAADLRGKGFTRSVGVKTWDSVVFEHALARVRLTSMPGRHGPPVVERLLPPVMGSLLEFAPPGGAVPFRLYVSGDTVVFDELKEIPRRFPDIDMALFHLGGARIMGAALTMDAEQGVEAIRIVNPREVVPIHTDDYDVFTSSREEFIRAATAAGFASHLRTIERGETLAFEVATAPVPAGG